MVTRDIIVINAAPDEVFSYLSSLSLDGIKISKKVKEYRMVIFTTGLSLFSFGESLEVIVQSEGVNSLVVFRAQGKVPWNITTDPRNIVQRVRDSLKEKFH